MQASSTLPRPKQSHGIRLKLPRNLSTKYLRNCLDNREELEVLRIALTEISVSATLFDGLRWVLSLELQSDLGVPVTSVLCVLCEAAAHKLMAGERR